MEEKETIYIGKVLRRLRKARLLSQEELAFQSGSGRGYISDLEKDIKSPSISMIFALAEVLDLRPSEFVKEIEESPDGE